MPSVSRDRAALYSDDVTVELVDQLKQNHLPSDVVGMVVNAKLDGADKPIVSAALSHCLLRCATDVFFCCVH